MKLKLFILINVLWAVKFTAQSQFMVDTTGSFNDPMYTVPTYLEGNGVTISNVYWWGSPMQFGVFRNAGFTGMDSGIVMTNGRVSLISDPASYLSRFTDWSNCTPNTNPPMSCMTPGINGYFNEPPSLINSNGVRDLALLAKYTDSVISNHYNPYTLTFPPLDTIYEFVGLTEFDFTALSDTTSITYSFIYAYSSYGVASLTANIRHAPFFCFASGPGISGVYSAPSYHPNGSQYFSWIPDVTPKLPVSFTTMHNDILQPPNYVNPTNFPTYMINNYSNIPNPPWIQPINPPFYAGSYSVPIEIIIPTIPCETYHIKLGIARGDTCHSTGCDPRDDSGVLLKAKSLSSEPKLDLVVESDYTLGFDTALVEGCGQTTVYFIRNSNAALSDTIHFNILGTATNGVDYTFLPDSIVFAAGDDSFALTFTILNDALIEGSESLIFDVIDSSFYLPCGMITTNLLQLTINDQPPFLTQVNNLSLNCTSPAAAVGVTISSGLPTYSYIWSNGDTLSSTLIQPTPTTDTVFFVTITDACNNQKIDSAIITVQNLPLIVLPIPGAVSCNDDSTQIGVSTVSGYAPYTYNWFNGDTDSTTTVWVPLDTNFYLVTVTDVCNRDTVLSVSATVFPYSPLTIGVVDADTFWCAPRQITISNPPITGGSGNHILSFTNWADSLNWFFGSTSVDTTVVLQVVDLCSLDTLIVNYIYEFAATGPFKVQLPTDTTICQGDSVMFVAVASGGYPPYNYVWDNGKNVNYRWVNIAGTQHYSVSVTDGCSDQIVKPLTVHPKYITAAFTSNTPEPLTVQLENQSSGADYYLWHFGDGDSSSTENPTHQYQVWDDYTISLFVEDTLGCFDSAQTFITLPLNIYVPNAFTPNKDEHNNVFEIKGIWNDKALQSFSINIFDRWGGMIYESNDIYFKWDGTSNGKPVNSGIYAYVIKVKFLNHELQTLTGSVNVVK